MFTCRSSSKFWKVGSGESRKKPGGRSGLEQKRLLLPTPLCLRCELSQNTASCFPWEQTCQEGNRYSPTPNPLHLWEEEWILSLSFYLALRSGSLSLVPDNAESSVPQWVLRGVLM